VLFCASATALAAAMAWMIERMTSPLSASTERCRD
jgi:hypothetical protein